MDAGEWSCGLCLLQESHPGVFSFVELHFGLEECISFMGRNSPKSLGLIGITKPAVGVGSVLPSSPSCSLSIPWEQGRAQIRGTNRTRAARKRNFMEFGFLLLPKLFGNCQLSPLEDGNEPFISVVSHGNVVGMDSSQSSPSQRHLIQESTALSVIFYIKYVYLYIKIETCLFWSVRKQVEKTWIRKQVEKTC